MPWGSTGTQRALAGLEFKWQASRDQRTEWNVIHCSYPSYIARLHILSCRSQNECYMPQGVPVTSAPEYQPQSSPSVSDREQHRNAKSLLPYHTRPPGPQTPTDIEGTTHPHEQPLNALNTTNEESPCSVDQYRISDDTRCPIIDINPTHFGQRAVLNGFAFYIEWQQFSFVDGIWKYVALITPCWTLLIDRWYPERIALVELTGQKLHQKSGEFHRLLEQPSVAKCLTENPTVGWPRVVFQNKYVLNPLPHIPPINCGITSVSCVWVWILYNIWHLLIRRRAFSITGATIGLNETPVTLQANFSQFIPDILSNLNPFSSAILEAGYLTESLAISDPNTAEPMEGGKRGSGM